MDWLPAARRVPHARSFAWQTGAPAKGVLHTTETKGRSSYDGWTIMPHGEVLPIPGVGVEVDQFLPFSQGSFSLVHGKGESPTGGAHAFQFELVGTCDKDGPAGAYYWPAADDRVLRDLWAKVINPLSIAYAIPLHTPAWKPYPASYGEKNGVRLSESQFLAFSGWLGHEHVPENVHGDPGNFPWGRLMTVIHPPGPHVEVIEGPVRYGMHGASVKTVQKHVHVPIDGIFGRQTLLGVEKFQRAHGLVQDGIVGPKTAAAMGARYVALRG